MKKKISISEYTKNAAALRTIELDQQAAKVLGIFEKYYYTHDHAQKIAETIMEAAKEGKTKCTFTVTKLNTWADRAELKLEQYSIPKLSQKEFNETTILKSISRQLSCNGIILWSYGIFVLNKVRELIPSFDCVAFDEGDCITLDWSDEVLKAARWAKISKVLKPFGIIIGIILLILGLFSGILLLQLVSLTIVVVIAIFVLVCCIEATL